MKNDFLCVFDLDGTLYPKKSDITNKLRERVISEISSVNNQSYEVAKKMYFSLPEKYPNPYIGLSTLGITGKLYEKAFLSIDVNSHISRDEKLVALFKELSEKAKIHILSFGPIEYIDEMLNALGVREYVSCIRSVSRTKDHYKGTYYDELYRSGYREVVVVGDDYTNDLEPALKYNFSIIHINDNHTIYNAIKKLLILSNT